MHLHIILFHLLFPLLTLTSSVTLSHLVGFLVQDCEEILVQVPLMYILKSCPSEA